MSSLVELTAKSFSLNTRSATNLPTTARLCAQSSSLISTAPLSDLPDIRNLLPGHRLDDVENLIIFWALDSSYNRDPQLIFPAATIAHYTIDPNDASKWMRAPSTHPVDQLIQYSSLCYPIRFDLGDHRHRFLQPSLDDPEYDPTQNYDPPLRHNTLTPPMVVEGEDNDSSRVWTESEVQDPLDSSLAPDFDDADDTSDPIPDLAPAEESIEDNILSDIEDHQVYLHSLEDDDISMHEPVPPRLLYQAERQLRPIPATIIVDLPGKRSIYSGRTTWVFQVILPE